MGESYYGYTSLMAALSGHPAIKAISPANITLAREKQSLDGAFPLQASGMWTLDMDDAVNGEYQAHGIVTHIIDRDGQWRANFHDLKFSPVNMVLFINALTNDAHSKLKAKPEEQGFWSTIRKWL